MKYTRIALTVCSVSAAFFLSACGGGSSSSMSGDATGTFIDAPVENLKYSCDPSGISGVTNANGQFGCNFGDEVSFYIGEMTIGPKKFEAEMVITPYKLYPTDAKAAVRLAQLLQSLDDDGDISERITILEKYAEAITEALDPEESNFANIAQALLDEVDVTLVDEKAAKAHLVAQDTSSPVVTLMGDAQVTIKVGEVYMDAGATAYDEFDGKMNPVKSGSVDTSKPGTYTITYQATDQAGYTGSISRKVIVIEDTSADTTAPVVTLNGEATVTITVGDSYSDAGATATDNVDGALSPSKSGSVDTSTAGSYTITWSATDAAGNVGSASRTVIVEEAQCQNVNPITGGCED
ncbi:MAG: DUF5011 domain-containing protein, partial [Campylobacterales bacterium]|nr:DUF5011 domain-containing protein [Campylobacterales bacterium]